jgi:hypothetical protein
VPVFRSGPRRRRARVTIDFFNLHGREDLIRERADIIINIARAYADAVGGANARRRRRGEKDLLRMLSPASAHSNCANCFYRLLASSRQADRDRAENILDEIYGPE